MLPTRANTLTHTRTQSVPWTEPEPLNDVVMGANNPLLPYFNSMLDSDWYMDQNESFLMHNFDSSSSHFAVPPKLSFSSFFTNPFDNNAFDLNSQSEFLAELSSFPASQQPARDTSVEEEEVFFSKGEAVRSVEGPPTLFRKRAERREGGELGELLLQDLKLPLVPPRFAAAAGTELERGGDGEGVLNCEFDADYEVGKLVDNGFGGNVNGGEVKGKKKKGMPAKNLMAERRRRKRLNDRLYMLRSVVPKISKMDRASILGDAVDYLKELLQRLNDLHKELESSPPGLSLPTSATFHPMTPTLPTLPFRVKEELCPTPTSLPSPKNQSAKVEVKVREGRGVNIHMFCDRKPGLLLSTVRALDKLGLDVQQAVISCFNGFALDVFRAEQCREDQDVLPEQIKAVLLDTAASMV